MSNVPSDPKLKSIRSGGKWVYPKKVPIKVVRKPYTLGKEIADFYAKQRQDKKREEGGHKTQ